MPSQFNDGPGYGEEPEVAYDSTSFDIETTGPEASSNDVQMHQQDHYKQEEPQSQRYNVTMKEDG